MKNLYGAFLHLQGRRCIVVGGGPVAERKITGLLDCAAQVTVIAPEATAAVEQLAAEGRIDWMRRPYRHGDVSGAFLTVAATDSKDVNRQVCEEAEAEGRLVNVVNDQDTGNLVVPAVVRRGPLTLAVSTSGASPLVAKRLKQELEAQYGEEYGTYLNKLAEIRKRLLLTEPDEKRRQEIFRAIVDSDLLALLRAGRVQEAELRVADIIGG